MERSGTSAFAVFAGFGRFCHVGVFGDLGDLVVPTLRGASGDGATAYASEDTKGRLLQSLALPRAGQGPCEGREITVSANNGLHVCMGWHTSCSCSLSPQAAQKSKFLKLVFLGIMTTHNDHPSHAKHVLGSIYVLFYGYWVCVCVCVCLSVVSPKGLAHNVLMQFFTLGSSKIEVSKLVFLGIVTTYNDHPSYAKRVLGSNLCVFHPIWVLGAGR